MLLSELQRDVLTEMFNIGVGRAASSLSQIVDDEVLLNAPEVRILSSQDANTELCKSDIHRCSSVSQTYTGPFRANALLVFPENNALEIVSLMMGQHIAPAELAEFEQETMCEVGNIILNACISALADMIQVEFKSTLPVHCFGNLESLFLSGSTDQSAILLLQVDLIISKKMVHGHILFLLGVDDLTNLIHCIDGYLEKNGIS